MGSDKHWIAKKLNVVMPVNASNIYYGSYRPITVCVMCPKRICTAKPYIFLYGQSVKPGQVSLSSTFCIRVVGKQDCPPHDRMSSIDPRVLICT